MSLPLISPAAAKSLIDQGAVLIDVREADEHARNRIAAARHAPLSSLGRLDTGEETQAVIFHCKTGNRTGANASRLAQSTNCKAFILDGGFDAWKGAGLPVVETRGQPIEMMRQVQITAGALVLIGAILGAAFNPGFYALSAFVGAGLVFAGVSGSCMMARLLGYAPWNRRGTAKAFA